MTSVIISLIILICLLLGFFFLKKELQFKLIIYILIQTFNYMRWYRKVTLLTREINPIYINFRMVGIHFL